MIFQWTYEEVLSGRKRQTSRLWKDDYTFSWDEYDRKLSNLILSKKAWDAGKIRCLYRVGQILSVQPARGKKGIAKIKVSSLAKRDVRDFTAQDIEREGFDSMDEFLRVWVAMNDKQLFKKIEHYSQPTNLTGAITDNRPSALYTALVIGFELYEG